MITMWETFLRLMIIWMSIAIAIIGAVLGICVTPYCWLIELPAFALWIALINSTIVLGGGE